MMLMSSPLKSLGMKSIGRKSGMQCQRRRCKVVEVSQRSGCDAMNTVGLAQLSGEK